MGKMADLYYVDSTKICIKRLCTTLSYTIGIIYINLPRHSFSLLILMQISYTVQRTLSCFLSSTTPMNRTFVILHNYQEEESLGRNTIKESNSRGYENRECVSFSTHRTTSTGKIEGNRQFKKESSNQNPYEKIATLQYLNAVNNGNSKIEFSNEIPIILKRLLFTFELKVIMIFNFGQ